MEARVAGGIPDTGGGSGIRDVKADGGFNIETLETSTDQQRLMVGFRGPLLDNRAIIASVENLTAMFEVGEPPRISTPVATGSATCPPFPPKTDTH